MANLRKGRQQTYSGQFPRRNAFVWVAGRSAAYVVETSHDPRKVDHVWIDVHAGDYGLIRVALNTCSIKNRDAGFDPRVRLGVVTQAWNELPSPGMRPAQPLDYGAIEASHAVVYVEQEQRALESLLLQKAQRAVLLEGWGEFYMQQAPGIHQLHSRRGSYAMPQDYIGRDGAVQFYFEEERTRELLLFKFAGQP